MSLISSNVNWETLLSVEKATIPLHLYGGLDGLCHKLYTYYREGGCACIVLERICSTLMVAFTIFYSTFLFLFVDWSDRIEIRYRGHDYSKWGMFVLVVYLSMCTILLLWYIWLLPFQIANAFRLRALCKEALGIRNIQDVTWTDMEGALRDALRGQHDIQDMEIGHRIMREDHYMISFVNQRVFSTIHMNRTLEWSIRFCVLRFMLDDKSCIRKSFLNDVHGLQKRFMVCGVMIAVFAPFVCVFMLLYMFIKHVEAVRKDPRRVWDRQWTPFAQWGMREYNELPHEFEWRLQLAQEPTTKYLQQFPHTFVSTCARFSSYLLGAWVGTLLAFAFVSENTMESRLYDRDLWWYLAVCTTALVFCHSMIDPVRTHDPKVAFCASAAHTHHYPAQWRGREHTRFVCRCISDRFPSMCFLLLEEMWGIFTAPFVLCTRMPAMSKRIIDFVEKHSVTIPNVGDVCAHSTFHFAAHGNPRYGAPLDHANKEERTRQGKLEKSIMTFVTNHPTHPLSQHPKVCSFVHNICNGEKKIEWFDSLDAFYRLGRRS